MTTETVHIQEIQELLESLRYKPDMVGWSPDTGERCWFTESFDRSGKRNGIVECCLEAEPCDYHSAMTGAVKPDPLQRPIG